MKKLILAQALTALFLIPVHAVQAADVTGLTTFSSGTPAVASQVNGNFNAVKSAVDNNHSRIIALETGPSLSGNITLVPSTAAAGNILKGTAPFLHDFGNQNTFLGENAGNFSMIGGNNTASGTNALRNNTTGTNNVASGTSVLSSNTTGNGNTGIGMSALQDNTTGSSNTATGSGALANNTTGQTNTATGINVLLNNTAGNNNTATGAGVLQTNTTGNQNAANGSGALFLNSTGSNNTASGAFALQSNTTGNHNIAIGFSAGSNLTTGSNNIDIGNTGVVGDFATIRIGSAQARTFIDAIRGVTTGVNDAIPVVIDSAGQLGTVSSSRRFKDDIADMGETSSVLKQLRPVTFHYKSDQNPKGRSLQYGLIAEEVEKVAPNLVARSANGEIETVFYQHLTPMLLNEYQQQQRVIEMQTAELKRQTERVAQLEKQAAHLAMVLGRLERAGLVTTAGR